MTEDQKNRRMSGQLAALAKLNAMGLKPGTPEAFAAMIGPKKPGRPATGQTPPSQRTAKAKQVLLAAGGRRLTVNLSPQAAQRLAAVRKKSGHTSDRDTIEHAIGELWAEYGRP